MNFIRTCESSANLMLYGSYKRGVRRTYTSSRGNDVDVINEFFYHKDKSSLSFKQYCAQTLATNYDQSVLKPEQWRLLLRQAGLKSCSTTNELRNSGIFAAYTTFFHHLTSIDTRNITPLDSLHAESRVIVHPLPNSVATQHSKWDVCQAATECKSGFVVYRNSDAPMD